MKLHTKVKMMQKIRNKVEETNIKIEIVAKIASVHLYYDAELEGIN